MADLLAPNVAGLLRQAQPCYCQSTDGFVAIPDTGTLLVQDGRAATIPEPALPSLGNLQRAAFRGEFAEDGERHD